MISKRFSLLAAASAAAFTLHANPANQGLIEKLDRGVVALPASGSGIFISWRFLATDDEENTRFEILRNGESIVKNRYKTNYTDPSGNKNSTYQIVTFIDNQAVDTTQAISPWGVKYKKLVLQGPAKGANGGNYDPNDCSVGDVDGDGEYEIFVKWNPSNAKDNAQDGVTDNVFIDCYKLDGTKLWRVDLGRNIRAGAHYTQHMVYDFDGDGKAEMMCKTAPGSIDGDGKYVNSAATDTNIKNANNSSVHRNSGGRITGGQEWLTVFDGQTGRAIHTIFYNPNRNTTYGGAADGSFNWDDRSGKNDKASYGNRGERYLAAVAHIDGADKPACGIFCRGYYTFAFIWAVGFDGTQLHQRWLNAAKSKTSYTLTTYNEEGKGSSKSYTANKATSGGGSNTIYGNGNHNMSVADVDGDGCDEIVWGASAVDHDGKLLYATGFGHGDALHLSDLNPERPGLEMFQVHEGKGKYAWDVHDAATGEIIHKGGPEGVDNGRGIAVQLDAKHHGFYFNSGKDKSQRSAVTGEVMSNGTTSNNFRAYWDGDLQDELLDGNKLTKWTGNGTKELLRFSSLGPSSTCNGSKNTPNLSADIFGDWREEIILYKASDTETCLAIYSTNTPTNYRMPTLMHDHTYRMGIAWQNCAYNQPPHLGYYLPDAMLPRILSDEKTITVSNIDEIDQTFITRYTSKVSIKGCQLSDGTTMQELPGNLECAIDTETRRITIKGKQKEIGCYKLLFALQGMNGENVNDTITLNVMSPTGIKYETIMVGTPSLDVIYDSQGRKRTSIQKGINILRRGNRYLKIIK